MKSWVASGIKTGHVYAIIDKYPESYASKKLVNANLKNGLAMKCNLQDHIQSRIYFFGAYEPIEVHLLSTLLDQDSVFLDVGANIGFYAMMLSKYCKRVYAFEPVGINYEALKKNVESNNLTAKVKVIKKGLWTENKTLEFSLPNEDAHNLGTFTAVANANQSKNIVCEVVSLDSFVKEEGIDRVDVIKMDIEGAEIFALRGARHTITQQRPILQIELNTKACENFNYPLEEIRNYFADLNYSFYRIGHTAETSEFIGTFDNITQVNVLALPNEKKALLDTRWNAREVTRSFLN